ncbi:unnamed protein product [Diabrotica balteata]|uniref:Tyrosinase copper-binding domain-containing protein n=1 Tax=Diabrotica balteata TaxID=107213 RepID=A0A9N9SQT0_DIABA|nr:unnamed protein product [Diabrotica balteata]
MPRKSLTAKEALLLLFDRPREPIDLPKGPDGVIFKVPKEYLREEYQHIKREPEKTVTTRSEFVGEVSDISVPLITLPSLGEITDLRRDENFSLFIPKHRRLAGLLIQLFIGMKNTNDLLSMATYAREYVNPVLFTYALSVALLHRSDTKDLDLPSALFSFPDMYVDHKTFSVVREVASAVTEKERTPIIIPKDYTASHLEEEQRLAYFREDIGVNLHHWHWHLVYPFEGPMEVVNKDRRGELFYYMHQQIIARYNFERLCNGLKRVEKTYNFIDVIPEAYYPKLDSMVASRSYPARVPNMRWQNLRREADGIRVDVEDMVRWRERIFDAIDIGYAKSENRELVELTENEGIDILGNMVESSILSPNRDYYGDLHNMGHILLGFIHDPDNRYLEMFAVMGDVATAVRDPIFYRWHAALDDIFQNHKDRLPRYTVDKLNFDNITIQDVQVQTAEGPANKLQTYWQQFDVDLSKGLDIKTHGPIFVRLTYLNHVPFTYKITVNNNSNGPTVGTCRIFMAPKFDEKGKTWLFRNQKNLFIELDKFKVNLDPGTNTITRKSSESSVTIPFDRTYRNLDKNPSEGGDHEGFCRCGWPENMLIPKGCDNFEAELFVMISDYAGDRIDQDVGGHPGDAGSYCGLKNKLYPDRRSMGYPFDRQPRDGVNTLQDFLTPNMRVRDVIIKFNDRTLAPGESF